MTANLALSDEELATVRAILGAHLPVQAKVHVFGSRATGTAKPWSDLDLILEADRPLPLAILAELAEAFAESPLAWKVDLIDRFSVSESFGALIDRAKVPLPR